MERDLLIYQPDRFVDADKRLYRVAWYGGESTLFVCWGTRLLALALAFLPTHAGP